MTNLTIGYTIHNKQDLLPKLISGLAASTNKKDEILFLFDNCKDDSLNVTFREAKKNDIDVIGINFDDGDLYEVKANNELLRWFMLNSKNNIIALFQDDIVLKDKEFTAKINYVLSRRKHYFGVLGGRSGFELKSTKFPEEAVKKVSNWEHRQSQYGDKLRPFQSKQRTFINRGPIVFTREIIEEVGYLDEAYYPQWGDELDYCARCKFQYHRQNAVFQCDVECKEEWGTMRSKPNPFIKKAIKPNWERFINKWGEYLVNEKN